MKNEEIKDLITLHTQAIKGEIKAGNDMLNFRMDTLEKKIDNNVKVVNQIKKETLAVRLIHRHPRVSLFIIVLVVFGFIFLTSHVEFKDLLFFIKR